MGMRMTRIKQMIADQSQKISVNLLYPRHPRAHYLQIERAIFSARPQHSLLAC
jgi:hypothetical protein